MVCLLCESCPCMSISRGCVEVARVLVEVGGVKLRVGCIVRAREGW